MGGELSWLFFVFVSTIFMFIIFTNFLKYNIVIWYFVGFAFAKEKCFLIFSMINFFLKKNRRKKKEEENCLLHLP